MKCFSWPSEDMIRQANSLVLLDNYKLKRVSVKTVKGKIVALQIGLGDGSVSPVFGEQDCAKHWDISERT